MDHIAHIKNTGGLDNESVTEETVSEHCKKTALLARSYSIWKVQFSFLLYYTIWES